MQHLDRDAAWQHDVHGLVDGPHSAGADLARDPIGPDQRARLDGHDFLLSTSQRSRFPVAVSPRLAQPSTTPSLMMCPSCESCALSRERSSAASMLVSVLSCPSFAISSARRAAIRASSSMWTAGTSAAGGTVM